MERRRENEAVMEEKKKPVIGFIGLGAMGLPMAINLVRAGYEVRGSSRAQERAYAFAKAGGKLCVDLAGIVEGARVIITMVPDGDVVQQIISRIASLLRPGTIFIDMSTIGAPAARSISRTLAHSEVSFLDAPVSGGVLGAEEARLSIMVGGEEEIFHQALPIFEVMGKNIRHLGAVGSGQIVKTANQMMVAASLAALSEAILLLENNEINTEAALDVIKGGLGDSAILRAKGEKMREREFTPSFSLKLHKKDMRIACKTARDSQTITPVTNAIDELFSVAEAHRCGELDHSALIRAFEVINGK